MVIVLLLSHGLTALMVLLLSWSCCSRPSPYSHLCPNSLPNLTPITTPSPALLYVPLPCPIPQPHWLLIDTPVANCTHTFCYVACYRFQPQSPNRNNIMSDRYCMNCAQKNLADDRDSRLRWFLCSVEGQPEHDIWVTLCQKCSDEAWRDHTKFEQGLWFDMGLGCDYACRMFPAFLYRWLGMGQ